MSATAKAGTQASSGMLHCLAFGTLHLRSSATMDDVTPSGKIDVTHCQMHFVIHRRFSTGYLSSTTLPAALVIIISSNIIPRTMETGHKEPNTYGDVSWRKYNVPAPNANSNQLLSA